MADLRGTDLDDPADSTGVDDALTNFSYEEYLKSFHEDYLDNISKHDIDLDFSMFNCTDITRDEAEPKIDRPYLHTEDLQAVNFAPLIAYDDFAPLSPPLVDAPQSNDTVDEIPVINKSGSCITSVTGSGAQTPYLNSILNRFGDPAIPLRIIDQAQLPFPEHVETALQRHLSPQNRDQALYLIDGALKEEQNRRAQDAFAHQDREFSTVLHGGTPNSTPNSFLEIPKPSPRRSNTSSPGNRTPKNSRSDNIAKIKPETWYIPLPFTPVSWGGTDSRSHALFNYTKYGELETNRWFEVWEIAEYLRSHPLHDTGSFTESGEPIKDTKISLLTLWIQFHPSDSASRHPTPSSGKCRFANCPDPRATIRNGEFRITFDEQHLLNPDTDPFHNAGYVHLYCMEKNFDFALLCRTHNVRADVRPELKEGSNRMAVTRDRKDLGDVCDQWVRDSQSRIRMPGERLADDWFEHSLTRALTKAHSELQNNSKKRARDKREGNNIEIHLGDLDQQAEYRRYRTLRKATEQKGSRAKRPRQESDESGLDDDILDKSMNAPSMKRRKNSAGTGFNL